MIRKIVYLVKVVLRDFMLVRKVLLAARNVMKAKNVLILIQNLFYVQKGITKIRKGKLFVKYVNKI